LAAQSLSAAAERRELDHGRIFRMLSMLGGTLPGQSNDAEPFSL
jgi:hypothetical protein